MGDFDTLVGLVEHYSPSGQESGAVEWLVGRMQALGFSQSFVDGTGNAVGLMGGGPQQVILLGHIDTVPGEIRVTQIDNLLYGRGSVDAKGPLACFVDAVAQVGPVEGWQFVVIGAVDEERDSLGARFIMDQYRPDFAVIGEPNAWDRVALGYKGSAWAEITVQRDQSHSASGEQTAVETAVSYWMAVKAYAESFNSGTQRMFDRVLPTLRKVESGEDDFEQWARLRIGVRLPVEMPPDDWYRELETIFRNSTKHYPPEMQEAESFKVAIERTGYPVPAWECEKNSPLVRTFLNGIRQAGGTPRFVYKTGTADLNVVAPVWRCPAVVYGPGDSSLDHTPHEHLSLVEYMQSVHVLTGAFRKLVEP